MTNAVVSRLPGELRVLAVRLKALGMNARPLWDAAKLAATHAKEETPQGKQEPASNLGVSEQARLLSGDAGLSAEREAEIRQAVERDSCITGSCVKIEDARALLAALDAERERRKVMEQRGDNLKVEAGTWRDFAHFHKERAERAEQRAETLAEALDRIADYRTETHNYDGLQATPFEFVRTIVRHTLAGYRAGRDEAKP